MTHEVNFENFEATVDSHPLVILDFWAEWCAPCKVLAPVFEELSTHHPEIFFGKVNTEKAPELAAAFQVRAVPTLMAFKNSELVFEQPGLLPPEGFLKLIAHLKSSG